MTFDLSENGCSKIEITFNKLPDYGELNYRQRIDVHLFNDPRHGGVGILSLGLLRVLRKTLSNLSDMDISICLKRF